MSLSCRPHRGSRCLRVLGPCVHHRPPLVVGWRLGRPLIYGHRANRQALSRHGPVPLASQHSRRLRGAASGCTTAPRWGFAEHALQALPPPADGSLSGIRASTLTGQRGSTPPVAQHTRRRPLQPSGCGFRRVLLRAQGGGARLPGACAWRRRQEDVHEQTETALVRQRWRDCRPPPWGQDVVVGAEAADASRPHMARLQALGSWDGWALPRTWQFPPGKALQALVPHVPRWGATRRGMPTGNGRRRRTFWGYAKRVRRRPLGEGTVGRSPGRRHDGPQPTTSRVTNRPEPVTARPMGASYRRRWWVARLIQAREGGVGRGPHRVTTPGERVERSVAVALMASRLLRKRRAKDLPADQPGSALRRPRALTWEGMQAQGERAADHIARHRRQMGKAA